MIGKRKIKIAVYGSSADDEPSKLEDVAWSMGEQIAKGGNIIITGACGGLPFKAVEGAKSLGGYSIGYTAVSDRKDHEAMMKTSVDCYDELKLIPKDYIYKDNINICRKYRNVSSVADCDGAFFISGRWGTLNEFAVSYDIGRVIGVCNVGGGKFSSCVKSLSDLFNKKSDSKIIYDSDPVELYNRLIKEINGNRRI